jgi:hypothetical protein
MTDLDFTGILSSIGPRGVVVHEGDSEDGTYRFVSDNGDQSWRNKPINLADIAAGRELKVTLVEDMVKNSVTSAVFQPTGKGKTYFLNLEGFKDLPETPPAPVNASPSNPSDAKAIVLIREQSKYYAVEYEDLQGLSTDDAGEARIVVRRGAVVAAIRNNTVPLGTNCVLINLTQLIGVQGPYNP